MRDPLVSILIPCHNAAPWLEQTLASARAQTWRYTEIVLVDDGSTDDSLAIARRHASPRLLVLSQPNAGAAAARQRALEASQGNYIQYLDADDLLAPDKIERQIQRLRELAPRTIASSRWARFEHDMATARFAPEPNWCDLAPADYLVRTFTAGSMMHPAAWLAPREVISAAGPWNAELGLDDDGEYFTRVVLASSGIAFCEPAVSFYRSNLARSLSGSRSATAWRSAFRVCENSTSALLTHENSARSRRACALYWLRFAFAAYPEAGRLVDEALAHARALDRTARRPRSGPFFETAALLLGWKNAKSLRQRLANRKAARSLAP